MRILLACEESQETTKAMRERGHECYSCDIEPCSGGHPEWHLEEPVEGPLKQDWDLIIAHPPCTYLANSGVSWLTGKRQQKGRFEKMRESAIFFRDILKHPCPKIAIENPIPHGYALEFIGRKYDQIVHPFWFGHPERKATCFWLKGLPPLTKTHDVEAEMKALPKSEQQKMFYLPPTPERSKLRSKTYPGLALAMAEQWG